MSNKKNHKYLIVDDDKLKFNLKGLIAQLKNIYYDENDKIKFFYGGGKIPTKDCLGSEIECRENLQLINDYLPLMKTCIKGHTNWSNMSKSQKKVANYLKFYLRVLTDKTLDTKVTRFPKYKSYMVIKYVIPEELY
tara:strand:+ start:16 stop:423 length:408 start_codon:yes stop_codon:yes gene_type:complete